MTDDMLPSVPPNHLPSLPCRPSRPRRALLVFLLCSMVSDTGAAEASDPTALPPRPTDRAQDRAHEPVRAISESGSFAVVLPNSDWVIVRGETDDRGKPLDLMLRHRDGQSFVKGRLARRHNRGIEGSLINESQQAKYLIHYDPESVEPELSDEDYTGSALFCGRLRQGPARRACSLVRVTLHGRQVIQLHSLIAADTPLARKRIQAQVETIFDSLKPLKPDESP